MAIALKPAHLKRYKDIAWLLVKYGRADLASRAELQEDLTEEQRANASGDPRAEELASDLEKLGPTFTFFGDALRLAPPG